MTRRLVVGVAIIGVLSIGTCMWFIQQHRSRNIPPAIPNQPQVQKPSAPKPKPSYVSQAMSTMSLRDKVASLFIFHTPGTSPSPLVSYVTMYKPSGVIFMGDNIPNTFAELRAATGSLTSNTPLPPFIATDEEGDTVKRLAADTFPGALTLRGQPPAAAQDAFAKRSALLQSVGVNLNFGIIADVTADPNSFIYDRVLGTTAQAASDRVASAVQGSKGKTLSTIKHFPGHGETTANSHYAIPTAFTSYPDWQKRVSLPFRAGISAGTDMVMFGHLRYANIDQQPATLSAKWHNIARNELHFDGLIITDDMIMLQNSNEPAYSDPAANAVAAVAADNDLLLYVLNHGDGTAIDPNTLIDSVVAAINDGRIDPASIDTRVSRILTVRHNMSSLLTD